MTAGVTASLSAPLDPDAGIPGSPAHVTGEAGKAMRKTDVRFAWLALAAGPLAWILSLGVLAHVYIGKPLVLSIRLFRRADVACVVLGMGSLAAACLDLAGAIVNSQPPNGGGAGFAGLLPSPLRLDVAATCWAGLAGLGAVLGPLVASRTRRGPALRVAASVFAAFGVVVSCFAFWNEHVTRGVAGAPAAAPYRVCTAAVPHARSACSSPDEPGRAAWAVPGPRAAHLPGTAVAGRAGLFLADPAYPNSLISIVSEDEL